MQAPKMGKAAKPGKSKPSDRRSTIRSDSPRTHSVFHNAVHLVTCIIFAFRREKGGVKKEDLKNSCSAIHIPPTGDVTLPARILEVAHWLCLHITTAKQDHFPTIVRTLLSDGVQLLLRSRLPRLHSRCRRSSCIASCHHTATL